MKPSAIYRRVIGIFGAAHQMMKAREECLEFALATTHYEQNRVPVEVVIEELADVIITAQQARIILGPELVDFAIQRKLDRLVTTMDSMPLAQKKRN